MGCTQTNVVRKPSGWSDVLELPNVTGDRQVSEEASGGRLHGAIYCPASAYAVVFPGALQGAGDQDCQFCLIRGRLELSEEVRELQCKLSGEALGRPKEILSGVREPSTDEGEVEDTRDRKDSGGLADDGGVSSDTPRADDTERILDDWRRAVTRAKADRDLANHGQGREGCPEDEHTPSAWKGRQGTGYTVTGRLLRDLEKLCHVARPREGGCADTEDREELLGDSAPSVLQKARAKVYLPHLEAELRAESLVTRSADRDHIRAAWSCVHRHDPQVSRHRPIGHEASLGTLQNSTGLYDFREAREVGGPEGIGAHSDYWELPVTYRLALERYREQLAKLIDFSGGES
jgi:hypothetical protein